MLTLIYLAMVLRTMYLCTKYRDEISMQLGMSNKTKKEEEVAKVLDNPMIIGLICGLISPALIAIDQGFAKFFFTGSIYKE